MLSLALVSTVSAETQPFVPPGHRAGLSFSEILMTDQPTFPADEPVRLADEFAIATMNEALAHSPVPVETCCHLVGAAAGLLRVTAGNAFAADILRGLAAQAETGEFALV